MNFFEEQLRFIIGNQSAFENAKYIGRACVASLDGGVKLKAEFVTRNTADKYEALKLTAIKPTDGEIDRLTLNFEDYFNKRNLSGIFKTPHIWIYNGKTDWYIEPTIAEKAALGDAVQDYTELFELQKSINMKEKTSPLPKLKDLLSMRFEDVHIVHKDEEHNLATIVELDKNTLTEQGKEAWSDILNASVHRIYDGDYGVQIEVDGVDAERLFEFSYMLAGHCPSSDYDKWVNDAPDSQDINLNM